MNRPKVVHRVMTARLELLRAEVAYQRSRRFATEEERRAAELEALERHIAELRGAPEEPQAHTEAPQPLGVHNDGCDDCWP